MNKEKITSVIWCDGGPIVLIWIDACIFRGSWDNRTRIHVLGKDRQIFGHNQGGVPYTAYNNTPVFV